jgi:hypothetical protein
VKVRDEGSLGAVCTVWYCTIPGCITSGYYILAHDQLGLEVLEIVWLGCYWLSLSSREGMYRSLPPGLAKNNYFTLDSMKIKNYRRFVPKSSKITLKCLKFGKFILIY